MQLFGFNIARIKTRKSVKSAYQAALGTRLTDDWAVSNLSADAATRWSLPKLRARARDLERNGGIHERYLSAVESNVIGSEGVIMQMKVLEKSDRQITNPMEKAFLLDLQLAAIAKVKQMGRQAGRPSAPQARMPVPQLFTKAGEDLFVEKGQPDRFANALIEDEWWKSGGRGNFDVTHKHSRNDFWRVTLRTSARDGDVINLVYQGAQVATRWNFALQMLECDYLDDQYNVNRGGGKIPAGHTVRMGVELDRFKRKVALWVFASHPGDYGTEGVYSYDGRRLRIPILGCGETFAPVSALHIGRTKRPEETRPVPWITPAMNAIKMLEGYEEAELVAARAQACKHVFYERNQFAPDGSPLEYAEETSDGHLAEDMEPGGSTELPLGYHANFFNPTHPNLAFPDFVKSMKRKIASALNCAYNTLFVDLESVNYSSIRAGLFDERESWKMLQSWFSDDVVGPTFEAWLRMQLLNGVLPFGLADFDRLNAPLFKFRRWPWVDPKDDIEAKILAIDNNLETKSSTVAEMGGDWEEIAMQRRVESDMEEQLEIVPPKIQIAQAEADFAEQGNNSPGGASGAGSANAGKATEIPPIPQTINVNVESPNRQAGSADGLPQARDKDACAPQVINLNVDATAPAKRSFAIKRADGTVIEGEITEGEK